MEINFLKLRNFSCNAVSICSNLRCDIGPTMLVTFRHLEANCAMTSLITCGALDLSQPRALMLIGSFGSAHSNSL